MGRPMLNNLLKAGHTVIDDGDSGSNCSPTILISSHDFAEVESFATHVAFLHEGKLLFAEPMASLTARFREITVTLAPSGASSQLPLDLPTSWILPESSPSVFRFIHTNAETSSVEEQVRTVLPNAVSIQSEPMKFSCERLWGKLWGPTMILGSKPR
jgi:ABC-type uncharacterized transport system ATPase subunit